MDSSLLSRSDHDWNSVSIIQYPACIARGGEPNHSGPAFTSYCIECDSCQESQFRPVALLQDPLDTGPLFLPGGRSNKTETFRKGKQNYKDEISCPNSRSFSYRTRGAETTRFLLSVGLPFSNQDGTLLKEALFLDTTRIQHHQTPNQNKKPPQQFCVSAMQQLEYSWPCWLVVGLLRPP